MEKRNTALQRIRERISLRTRLEVLFSMEWGRLNIKDPDVSLTEEEEITCTKWVNQITNDVLKICKPYLKKTQPKTIEPFTMCRFNYDEYQKTGYDSPFLPQDKVIFLGEIRHMEGHCVVINTTTGKIETGWHTELFTEIPEDEI